MLTSITDEKPSTSSGCGATSELFPKEGRVLDVVVEDGIISDSRKVARHLAAPIFFGPGEEAEKHLRHTTCIESQSLGSYL